MSTILFSGQSIAARRVFVMRPLPIRWALCLLFPIGYLASFSLFDRHAYEYFALSILALLFCVIALLALRGPVQRALPGWILVLTFLVAYYVQFYVVALFPDVLDMYFIPSVVEGGTESRLFGVYALATLGFGACSLGIVLFQSGRAILSKAGLNCPAHRCKESRHKPHGTPGNAGIVMALGLSVFTSLAVWRYGMVMGVPQDAALPLHLMGVIHFVRAITVPILTLSVIQEGLERGRRDLTHWGGALLVGHGLSETILVTSKAAVASALLCVVFLWLVLGRPVPRRYKLLLIVAAAVWLFFVYPLTRALRIVEVEARGAGGGVWAEVPRLIGIGAESTGEPFVALGPKLVLTRLSGSAVLLRMAEYQAKPVFGNLWSIVRRERGLSGYLTQEVFGEPPEMAAVHADAPSLVGWFYFAGGAAGVAGGLFAYTVALLSVWAVLSQASLSAGAAVRAFFCFLVVVYCNDGVLDLMFRQTLIAFCVSVTLVEGLAHINSRLTEGRSK